MAIFTLEALDARSGDALLVHHGSPADPRLIIVDGGFAMTWRTVMRPRLRELRAGLGLRDDEALPIDLLVVSHVDQDHINGIVRLFRELRDDHDRQAPPPWSVNRLWHNAFDDAVHTVTDGTAIPAGIAQATAVAAGINDGRELRDLAEFFHLDGNPPFDGLVVAPRSMRVGGLHITVVGPTTARLDALREEWRDHVRAELDAGNTATVAAYVDAAVANLSSIVVHLRLEDRSMLLTGDARGDDVLAGLEATGLCPSGGSLHVDLLKFPHHGSIRNVETDFFERITADHYVISANGDDDNPSTETLRALVNARGTDHYAVHLTYDAGSGAFFAADRQANARNYEVRVRADGDAAIAVELGDPVA